MVSHVLPVETIHYSETIKESVRTISLSIVFRGIAKRLFPKLNNPPPR